MMGADQSKDRGKCPDFEAIRKDFPAIGNVRAYLDTAYVGLLPHSVKEGHEIFLEERIQFGPFPKESTILRTWLQKADKVRGKLASFMKVKEKEIGFTYCTGCGENIALSGIDWKEGDNAVTDELEYTTAIHILNRLKRKGVEVRIARTQDGSIPPESFEPLINKRTRALVVSHISYLNGFRHNLKRLAELIHSYKGYLIVDATQSLGAVQVDVRKEEVDLLTGAPYKWLIGPAGVGFFYLREDLFPVFPPDRLGWLSTENFSLLDTMESGPLPDHAKRFEYGTLNFEGIYALEVSIDYINRIGMKRIEEHNLNLVRLLRHSLSQLGVPFYTPENNSAPILTFFTDDEKAFGQKMREERIFVTTRYWKKGQVRISPHFYNNEGDIEAFVDVCSDVLKK